MVAEALGLAYLGEATVSTIGGGGCAAEERGVPMTGEKVKEVCDLYLQAVSHLGAERQPVEVCRWWAFEEVCRHACWMAQETKKLVDEGRIEKAMRWLGFMQGMLVSIGVYSISATMDHNRSKDEAFDPDR